MPRPWTDADDRLALALAPPEAAGRLGRTRSAVYQRRAKLRAESVKRLWTPAEDRLIMRMPPAIAVRYIRRSEGAINQRRKKLGLHKDRLPTPR
jgi:hypothetical protein